MKNKTNSGNTQTRNNKAVFKWLFDKTGAYIPLVILLAVFGAFISFFEVRFAFASKTLLDVATGAVDGKIAASLKTLLILLAVQLIFNVIYTFVNLKLQYSIKYKLQRNTFKNMLEKQVGSIGAYHTGELSNRLNSDTQIVTNGVISIFPNIIALVSQIIFSLIALYKMDSTFASICIVLGVFVMIISRLYGKKMKLLHKQHQLADGKVRSFMLECLQSIYVIKTFMCEKQATQKSKDLQKDAYKIAFKRNVISICAKILFFLTMTVGYYFALAWCAYKISIGIMTVGSLAAILQLVGQLQTPFTDLSALIPQYYSTTASAERLMEINELNDDLEHNSTSELKKLKDGFKTLTFENVEFSYGRDAVIKNASFTVKSGETVAISGISGIGKSTLFKLMLGIETPNNGNIIFSSDNVSLTVDKGTRCMFTYVPQGNMILSGTVRDNVAFFSNETDDEKVIECLKNACVWDYVSSLPDGLDTLLGEHGSGLSEGQRQRLAIARALYREAPIILLDEATSALDENTEEMVLQNIKNIANKTCIVISHKQYAYKLCDKQITILDGIAQGV